MSAVNALRKSLIRGGIVASKPKLIRNPSAYILFCNEKRKELASDAAFISLSAAEKMKQLGAQWSSTSGTEKKKYQDQAAALPKPVQKAVAEAPEMPAYIQIKSEEDLVKLSKQVEAAVMQDLFAELLSMNRDGGDKSVDKVGKFTVVAPTKEPKKSQAMTIKFQPSATLRKLLEQ